MATYASILTKVEDAVYTAFNTIAGSDLIAGVTVYKAGDQQEIAHPAILIEAVQADPLSVESATSCTGENYAVTVNISAVTHGEETTRTAHGNIAGLIEAVCFRSADQMVTEMEAANITDFQAIQWRANGISHQMDDQRRQTTAACTVGCKSR